MECEPTEVLVYRKFLPDAACNGDFTLRDLQREDGQFPTVNKISEICFGQIQTIVPKAAAR